TLDETERSRIPERGRAAVAEDDLVAGRSPEQVAQPRPHAAHEILHAGLAVRRPHEGRAGRHERLELRAADLRRSAAESTVGGQQFTRELDVGHGSILGAAPEAARTAGCPAGWIG